MKITLHCYIINYYLTQWTDNRMPDKRGTDYRGSTVFSIAVQPAISGFVTSSSANREYTGWLKDKVLKPTQKLSLVVTFVLSESARPYQITDLIKELYKFFFFFFLMKHMLSIFH